jgi:hypothetical protein
VVGGVLVIAGLVLLGHGLRCAHRGHRPHARGRSQSLCDQLHRTTASQVSAFLPPCFPLHEIVPTMPQSRRPHGLAPQSLGRAPLPRFGAGP